MRMTKEFKQHIIDQLARYVEDTRSSAKEYDESIQDMVLEDAAYAETVLNTFKEKPNWRQLRESLILQDTLPREECFWYLVGKDEEAAKKVGLTWAFIRDN